MYIVVKKIVAIFVSCKMKANLYIDKICNLRKSPKGTFISQLTEQSHITDMLYFGWGIYDMATLL